MLTEGKETRMTQTIPFSHFLYRKTGFIQKGHSDLWGVKPPRVRKCAAAAPERVRCLTQVSEWVLEMRL